jgi:hypothetical protein
MFPSMGEGRETHTLLGHLKQLTSVILPDDTELLKQSEIPVQVFAPRNAHYSLSYKLNKIDSALFY